MNQCKFFVIDGIYKTQIYIYAGYTWNEMVKEVKSDIGLEINEREDKSLLGCYIIDDAPDGKRTRIVFLKEADWTTKFYSNLAHECIHVVTEIFDARGVTYGYDNDEQFAYFFEFMYANILEGMKNRMIDEPKRKAAVKRKRNKKRKKNTACFDDEED